MLFLFIIYCNVFWIQQRISPRKKTSPKRLSFGFEAARNFVEYKEDEVERNDGIDDTGIDDVVENG